MKLDNAAQDFMSHVLWRHTQVDLTDVERHAAVTLLETLPRDTLIKDFMQAASPEAIARAGLPASVAEDLKPLLSRLELNLCYAGQFAALFDATTPDRVHQ